MPPDGRGRFLHILYKQEPSFVLPENIHQQQEGKTKLNRIKRQLTQTFT
jgi:hypothetical protein